MAGPQCCSNPPDLSGSCGGGHEEEVGGLRSYITGSDDSKIAVLLVSDVFGYEAPKLRKLADKVAGFGFYVVVPDFLQGDYMVWGVTPVEEWMKKHGPDQAFEHAKPVLEALKSKGITKVGAAGFCWGALPVVRLGSNPDWIQAGVVCHPVLLTEDDMKEVKVPLAIFAAELDEFVPIEEIKRLAHVLAQKPEVESCHKIYPGAVHGWTTRYDDKDEVAVKNAEEAHLDMLNWMTKYVK